MLQLCIFGGHAGLLTPEKKCYFTIFGGCELRRPTLAKQIISSEQSDKRNLPTPKMIFITLFGGTDIKCPTLAEEYLDLKAAVESRVLDLNNWDTYISRLDSWQSSSLMSLTLFAAFNETNLPSEDQEVEGLALQRHLGKISEESGRILEMGVGQKGSGRQSVIHQAVLKG